ncbi:hypothetical protein C8D94_102340 [Marinirhabdus gelatinilytica]|uniref:Uncharacterized protein n=2 Tax=Marinirhabdus gelatinilytica TaxID=1703343 RepID=A0A370QFL5_9FLAO|nr:hypothetical protein C8D94_102340 [Marinirhabdus gelatinilytica]
METNSLKIMKTLSKLNACLLGLLTLVLLTACEEPQDPQPPNTDPPEQIISVGQAKEMFDSYSDRRVPIIKRFEEMEDTTQAFNPTRFGEYDYQTVKQYMDFIESEAALADVEIGGLRFYLTNYPASSTFSDGTEVQYPRQNSFVLVPTTAVNGVQKGFITRTTPDGGRTIVLIEDLVQEQQQNFRQQNGAKDTGLNTKGSDKGQLVTIVGAKPRLLFINPLSGAPAVMQEGGDDVSLLLNESNLRPPPPNPDTDFD